MAIRISRTLPGRHSLTIFGQPMPNVVHFVVQRHIVDPFYLMHRLRIDQGEGTLWHRYV